MSTVDSWLEPADADLLADLGRDLGDGAVPSRPSDSPLVRVLVIVTAPLWLAVTAALAVLQFAVARHGPLLVLHERVGHAGRPLRVPKIATMRVPGNRRLLGGLIEQAEGVAPDGEVSTRLARWLRITGLDELPQLLLVASGSMRLVGPRPVTADELREMAQAGPPAVDHLSPGLLGVWQLLDRAAYDLAQRQALDEWMVARWGPVLRRRVLGAGAAQALRRLVRRSGAGDQVRKKPSTPTG